MDKLEKTLKYNSLLSIYKPLLSDTQRDILLAYYEYDLSISEIAVERNISRAAVEDAIKKGISKLDEFESKLNILEKKEKILKITAKLKENAANSNYFYEIEDIERTI